MAILFATRADYKDYVENAASCLYLDSAQVFKDSGFTKDVEVSEAFIISGYLNCIYDPVDFTETSRLFLFYCARLVLLRNAYLRDACVKVPESVELAYSQVIKKLDEVKSNKSCLEVNTPVDVVLDADESGMYAVAGDTPKLVRCDDPEAEAVASTTVTTDEIHRVVSIFVSGVSTVSLPSGVNYEIIEVDTATGTSQDPADFSINVSGLITASDTTHDGDEVDFLISFEVV